MNCAQVEDLLSAYLDNALAPEEYTDVAAHLQECAACRSILADFRRFDALLMQLPRVSPSPALRDRIFSSPEYLELTGTFDANSRITSQPTRPTRSARGYVRHDTPGRPHLVSMPGGRSTLPRQPLPQQQPLPLPSARRRRGRWGWHTIQAGIAVAILLIMAIGGLTARNLWLQQTNITNLKGAITPPSGLQQGPFPVGMRFVFQRDGALWSAPINGSTQAVRLTLAGVAVASNWVVSPAHLYILSTETGSVEMVPLAGTGSASHPAWSPDGIRVAFEFTAGNTVSIMDYNTQNHGLLTISDAVRQPGDPAATILTLDWSPGTDAPTITWSVGEIGHVHSIWLRRVGIDGTEKPLLLTAGDYVQAIYNPAGHAGLGSWLLVTSIAGRQGDLWYVDAVFGARLLSLTTGKQVGLAWWAPDGTRVDYLNDISAGVGDFHVVNVTTRADTLIASGVADEPAPAWSEDSQELVYSTGTQTIVVSLDADKKILLHLRGPVSALTWSANSPDQLVVALRDSQQGIYLVDVQRNTSRQLDPLGTNSPILWTEIP